jgi:hypothetical protein
MSQVTSVSKEKQERQKRNPDSISGDATKLAQIAQQHADRARMVEMRWQSKLKRFWGIFGAAGLVGTIAEILPKMRSVTEDDLKFLVETGGPKSLLKKAEEQ